VSRIEIISASAGTGKTWRLAEVLEDGIASGAVRPEAVLATTFTRRAAAELEERARRRLIGVGRVADAERLAAARIGTVNAVAGRLAVEFAFELGISPRLRVLDESSASHALRDALGRVLLAREQEEVLDLQTRLVDFRLFEAVEAVLARARANGIDAVGLLEAGRRSVEAFMPLFGGPPAPDGGPLERALEAAISTFLTEVNPADATKKTHETVAIAEDARARLRSGRGLRWQDWIRLRNLDPARRSHAAAEPVRRAAEAIDLHPRLRADIVRAIELVFGVAARALSTYEAEKRRVGAVDFTDQEVLALRALSLAPVRDQLAGELDLVLVDEFQDTSPVQLAIFLKLAELAQRSVWVGDQKQSIYGFRDADPALMDAALDGVLGGREPEALARSWRSRPSLVQLTSDVFARAFAPHGIPASRVRLEPARDEPPHLGVTLERWETAGRTRQDEARSLASLVREILCDAEVLVRDPPTGAVRRPRGEDVAILCRTNEACAAVATALEGAGVRCARSGTLGAAPEVTLSLAALALFIDPNDALAAAEIARLVAFPADPDGWLAKALASPSGRAFDDLEAIGRVRQAREACLGLSGVAALDAAAEAVGVRDACLAWGDADRRLARLEALRARARAWCAIAEQTGAAAGTVGLLEYLRSEAPVEPETREPDAVRVETLHGAKGLEWPIVVLFELDTAPQASALGVHMASDRDRVDLADPLAGRWLRYWPNPFHPSQTRSAFHARLGAHAATADAEREERHQTLRLMYVGWTRARDRLVLAARPGAIADGAIAVLVDGAGTLLLGEPGNEWTICGRAYPWRRRVGGATAPAARLRVAGRGYSCAGPRDHPPAWLAPSAMGGTGMADDVEILGPPLLAPTSPFPDGLGNALHAFFAADEDLAATERQALAADRLRRFGVASKAVRPEVVILAADRLRAWAARRWSDARWLREWPVIRQLAEGTVLRGAVDIVLDTDQGLVIVDHKCVPLGDDATNPAKIAAGYGPQVGGYAEALAMATGRPIAGCFVHFPFAGVIVRMHSQ
jgi:ATP-dependent exoDNAse (exonuclease V) beta subunit